MTKTQTFMTMACFVSLSGALQAQGVPAPLADKSVAFQYFVNDDKAPGNFTFARVEGLGMKAAAGRPLSATEERRTVQVLGDGTRIDKKETDKYFRDSEGRTRIEHDNGSIIVSDPVAGSSTEMSAANKTAHKMMVMRSDIRTASAGAGPHTVSMEALAMDKMKAEASAARPVLLPAPAGIGMATLSRSETFTMKESAERAATEDLGTQIINGVPAQGTRSTITIPTGQIGNDREIKVVSERWFSTDLQMLVKSSNSDPRFGETTYQLTNIVQGAQDPSLFQIPADFNVNGPR